MANLTLRKNINRPLTIEEMDDNFQIVNSQFFITDTDPTTSDDSSKNFKIGCIWTNTSNNKKYECKDATVGNANWDEASFGGDFKGITEGNNTGYVTTYRANNPDSYGNIGNDAIDLSFSYSNSDVYGATGYNSIATGSETTASGDYSIATGYKTTASGVYSIATGYGTTASEALSIATGYNTTASGIYSIATGYKTTASGVYSIATGYGTTASEALSIATGYNTTASGDISIATGYKTTASGDYSIATGYKTTAENIAEFSIGYTVNDAKAFSTLLSFSNKTTDATQTALNSDYPITASNSVTLEYFTYKLLASQDDKLNKWIRTGSFFVDRTDSTCTISNEDGTDVAKDDTSWSLDFVANNENFDIKVTGKDSTNIVWQISLEKNIIYF